MDIESLLDLPKDYDIVLANHERLSRALPSHNQWTQMAKLCVDFVEGRQYSDEEMAILKEQGRPFIQKNKIAPLVRLMLGFNRQNRQDIKFLPGNDGTGTQEIAESLSAVAKQIAESNHSDWLDAEVFQDGIVTGRGYWDDRISFQKNRYGDVKEMVLDPFEVVIDPDAESYDPNDEEKGWGYWIYNRWMSISDIYSIYGDKAFNSVSDLSGSVPLRGLSMVDITQEEKPETGFGMSRSKEFVENQWGYLYNSKYDDHYIINRRLIRVIDCQHSHLKRANFFVDLQTGQEVTIPDDWKPETLKRIMQWAQATGQPLTINSGIRKFIRWSVTAADRVLFDAQSPYDRYTLSPYFPYFRRGFTRGMVDDLVDIQRELNKRSSALLHIIMSTANSGWLIEENSMEESMSRALEEAGARPGIHVIYKKGASKPEKIQPTVTPNNVKLLEQDATLDLKEIAGINDSALGQLDKVQSGRAIIARQKQSVLGAEMYFDNFSRSRELKGLQILDLIQKFYTEERILRAVGADGKRDNVRINYKNAAGDIINNLSLGKYNIAVDEAPASATFMQAQFQEALELIERGVPIPPDILIELSSMPNKDELKRRVEEERLLRESAMRMENLGAKMSMGIPPDQPAPPAIVDGQPNVIVLQPQSVPQTMPSPPNINNKQG